MACGLPVIATTNTGAENLYTDGVEGYIVPIRDSSAIREKVIYLYENPKERDLMAERALAKVHNMGGWHSYGQAMLDVYQKLIINNE
jgi:glycosyltransferase involved in cell wall biosynthesis